MTRYPTVHHVSSALAGWLSACLPAWGGGEAEGLTNRCLAHPGARRALLYRQRCPTLFSCLFECQKHLSAGARWVFSSSAHHHRQRRRACRAMPTSSISSASARGSPSLIDGQVSSFTQSSWSDLPDSASLREREEPCTEGLSMRRERCRIRMLRSSEGR